MKAVVIFILILVSSSVTPAQDKTKPELNDKEITEFASKLAMKLLLNDTQKSEVIKLLKTYRNEIQNITVEQGKDINEARQNIISATNTKIESILDDKQRIKYDLLEQEWWDSINEASEN